MNDIDFLTYMTKVDDLLEDACGMTSEELPDYSYRDAFDSGMTAARCSIAAIKNAGGF